MMSQGHSASRKPRALTLAVGRLEGRVLMTFAPVTTAALVGPQGLNGVYVGPVTVNLTASDVDSPANQITTFASVDRGQFVPIRTLSLTKEGSSTVRYFSRDADGNSEPIQSLHVTIDATAPVVTATPSRTSLFPPNGKLAPVVVSGLVTDTAGPVQPTVRYRVVDEYGKVQPSGIATVDASGRYAFVVRLQSRRLGQDKDGRAYTIFVTATDAAGNTSTTSTVVTVLHDRRKKSSSDNGNGNKNGGDDDGNGNNGKGNKGKNGNGNSGKKGRG